MQIIRKATPDDVHSIQDLVGQAGLNTIGIPENVDNFLIMEKEADTDNRQQALSAVVGFELKNDNGLLRSFVINDKSDQLNIVEIMRAVIHYSKTHNLKKLYLCTKQPSSIKLFQLLGFQIVEAEPEDIHEFTHFQNINSEQPIIMYYTF